MAAAGTAKEVTSALPEPAVLVPAPKRHPHGVITPMLEAGMYCEQGMRPTMEDVHVIALNLTTPYEGVTCKPLKHHNVSLCAVFDGHGGPKAAQWAGENFLRTFLEVWDADGQDVQLADVLRDTFLIADSYLLAHAHEEGFVDGTTAIVTLLVDNDLYIASVGDSRAIVCSRVVDSIIADMIADDASICIGAPTDGGSLKIGQNVFAGIPLNREHRPTDMDERARIEYNGGFVRRKRVVGRLAMSRSLGDIKYKPAGVIAEPTVVHYALTPADGAIVLACDGLWDVFETKEVAYAVLKAKAASQYSASDIARRLVRKAIYKRHSKDNVTCIVLLLHWE